ncbi:hypothetical protein BDY19DRAFT_1057168 [Irpex rosettiformis]|uniref:Uncharacterized protein n=1 Tax=Irpex rosettiformis TaxID=378272 RepID=A0ACB8U2J1_9APHY|nr:hypothetical protein BDY19DRAFT_1057168 [Irpex rosettiformis]
MPATTTTAAMFSRATKAKSLTAIELDDFSESMTIASLETSSTITVVPLEGSEHGGFGKFEFPAVTTSSEPGLQGDLVTFSRLLRVVATSENPDIRQGALSVVFNSYIYTGQVGFVVRVLVQHQELSFDLLRQIANYEPTPPSTSSELSRRLTTWTSAKPKEQWTTELRRDFLTELLRYCWDRLTVNEAEQICTMFKEEHSILKYLFPVSTQDRTGSTPRHVGLILTYFSRPAAEWPSLTTFEEILFRHAPEEWPISNIARILPSHTPSPELSAIVEFILKATRPNANLDPHPQAIAELETLLGLDEPLNGIARTPWAVTTILRRHPASPSLWLALYLADRNPHAASTLIAGGIVQNIRDLYDTDFLDPRVNFNGVATQSAYDLMQLCYMLLRVLFPRDKAGTSCRPRHMPYSCYATTPSSGKLRDDKDDERCAWAKAKELAEVLQEDLQGDLRYYRRQMSARYHDGETVYRDEILAEAREYREARLYGGLGY